MDRTLEHRRLRREYARQSPRSETVRSLDEPQIDWDGCTLYAVALRRL